MEILLYASGERQLKLAIPKIGVKKGTANIAFIFIGEGKILNKSINELLNQLSLIQDNKALEGNENTLKKFGISEDEKAGITSIVTGYGLKPKLCWTRCGVLLKF